MHSVSYLWLGSMQCSQDGPRAVTPIAWFLPFYFIGGSATQIRFVTGSLGNNEAPVGYKGGCAAKVSFGKAATKCCCQAYNLAVHFCFSSMATCRWTYAGGKESTGSQVHTLYSCFLLAKACHPSCSTGAGPTSLASAHVLQTTSKCALLRGLKTLATNV